MFMIFQPIHLGEYGKVCFSLNRLGQLNEILRVSKV